MRVVGFDPQVTVERAFFGVSQFVRVFSIAVMTILIPYSLNPAVYGITFKGLGLPDSIAYAMDLTMRFIPTFGRDFQLTMDAQRARGYELEKISGGLIQQVRKLGPLMVPVTIHAIIGSEDIIDAMDLRAFGTGPRSWLDQLTYKLHDRILIAFGGLIFAASLAAGFAGYGKFWVPPALLDSPKQRWRLRAISWMLDQQGGWHQAASCLMNMTARYCWLCADIPPGRPCAPRLCAAHDLYRRVLIFHEFHVLRPCNRSHVWYVLRSSSARSAEGANPDRRSTNAWIPCPFTS
jgi:hypothetical protein